MADDNKGGQGNTETPEQKAAAEKVKTDAAAAAAAAAAAGGKTPEQLAAEAAAAGGNKDGNKGAKDGESADPKTPVNYSLKMPEGDLAIFADESTRDRLIEIAKTEGWTNEEAQQKLDEFAASYKSQSDRFKEALKADPEYGGDKLAKTQQLANAVIEKVRPANTPRGKALRRILDQSGYGNHPEIVSFLADIGKMTGEDTAVGGAGSGGSGDQKKSPEKVLYGG